MSSLDCMITLARLRKENAELRHENEELYSRIDAQYRELCMFRITNLVNTVTPNSVYSEFQGVYKSTLIEETVSRYMFTIPDSDNFDRQCAINIIKKIGAECKSGLLVMMSGERISFSRG